jgi:hypothetical protein
MLFLKVRRKSGKVYRWWVVIKIKGSYEYLIVVILDKLWYLWGLDKITDFKNTGKLSHSFISKVLVLNRAISESE